MKAPKILGIVLVLLAPALAVADAQQEAVGTGRLFATIPEARFWYNGEKIVGEIKIYIADSDSAVYLDGAVETDAGQVPIRTVLHRIPPPLTKAEADSVIAQYRSPRNDARNAVDARAQVAADNIFSAGGTCKDAVAAAKEVYEKDDLVLKIQQSWDGGFVVVWKDMPNLWDIQDDWCGDNGQVSQKSPQKSPQEQAQRNATAYEKLLRRGSLILFGRDDKGIRYDVTVSHHHAPEADRLLREYVATRSLDPNSERWLRRVTAGAFADVKRRTERE